MWTSEGNQQEKSDGGRGENPVVLREEVEASDVELE